MNVCYVTNKKPRSYNQKGSMQKYKSQFVDEFNDKYANLYTGLPIGDKTLQSYIVYIHQLAKEHTPDVDNLSKPLVDAFCGVIYNDDKQIIRRSANIIALKDFDFLCVNATNMPYEVYEAFNNYYDAQEENILYFEVGEFDVSQIKIGEL